MAPNSSACNTMQYNAIPCNTMHLHAIPCNTMQYHAILCNTMQYHASLITADGAYHCPVGSIMAIFFLSVHAPATSGNLAHAESQRMQSSCQLIQFGIKGCKHATKYDYMKVILNAVRDKRLQTCNKIQNMIACKWYSMHSSLLLQLLSPIDSVVR